MWSRTNKLVRISLALVMVDFWTTTHAQNRPPLTPHQVKHPAISNSDLVGWPPPKNLRFIKMGPTSEGKWMDVTEVKSLVKGGDGFIDMTAVMRKIMSGGRRIKLPDAAIKLKNKSFPIPKGPQHFELVKKHLAKIDMDVTKKFLVEFTKFHTRFYWTDEAARASDWLMNHAKNIVARYNGTSDVYTFTNKDPWKQKNVFVRLEGRGDPSVANQVIILGGHIDSINLTCIWNRGKSCETFRSPGADDNGSGIAVLMEILRILMDSTFVPKRSVEFHLYTAEEVGCRGSIAVAMEYWKKEKNIVGTLNFDAIGYAPTKKSKKIGLQTRGTYEPLVQFIRDLADAYVDIPWLNNNMCPTCGSDFASWTEMGFPSANLNEIVANPHIHTENDTLEYVDFDYLKEYLKLGLAYVIEYGEPLY